MPRFLVSWRPDSAELPAANSKITLQPGGDCGCGERGADSVQGAGIADLNVMTRYWRLCVESMATVYEEHYGGQKTSFNMSIY